MRGRDRDHARRDRGARPRRGRAGNRDGEGDVRDDREGGVRRLAALVAVLLVAGCGSGGDSPHLTVFAATSLKGAFERYDPGTRYSFAASDELAAHIRQGSGPDVYAAANTKLPAQLYAAKLVDRPAVFATNRLVLAVPAGSSSETSLHDPTKPGGPIADGTARRTARTPTPPAP